MSDITELFPEDEQARLAAEAFRRLAGVLREKGFSHDAITSGLLGSGLQQMVDADGEDDAAMWLLGIAGKLKGVPAEQKSH